MLEIILLFFLYRKMGSILRAKGYKPLKFQILVPVVWIGGEFAGAVIFMLFTPPEALEGNLTILYLVAVLVAIFGVGALFIIAKGLEPIGEANEGVDGRRDLRDWK